MIDQVINMKKRYMKLVGNFSKLDFVEYFTQFFAIYPVIGYVSWTHQDREVTPAILIITPAYLARYPELEDTVCEEGIVHIDEMPAEHKNKWPLLYDAAADIRHLQEAKDVLLHVFKDNVYVAVRPGKIETESWPKGRADVTSTDSHQPDTDH